ncbi:hypothetical protein [Paractinoplanes globisporus]|uniref:GNAT family N-acetyltransferase n=1 Tax=Paractinoplanes globisporus TaxID=113565 RepID=A0ABW6WQ88_9ACTN|nr:hypothetical protein [Actinoplanes globisporus]
MTASVTDPQRMLHVADDAGRIAGYARFTYWTRPPDATANAAPYRRHATLGFVEVRRDFWFPELTFDNP